MTGWFVSLRTPLKRGLASDACGGAITMPRHPAGSFTERRHINRQFSASAIQWQTLHQCYHVLVDAQVLSGREAQLAVSGRALGKLF